SRSPSSSRAWSSAAPIAASTWRAAWLRSCRPPTTTWEACSAKSTPPPSWRACLWPAGTPGGRPGPTPRAATAAPTPPHSGGIPGETMAVWLARNPGERAADEAVLRFELARAQHPFAQPRGDLNRLRERLLDAMWDDIGVIRDAVGLRRGLTNLETLERELLATGVVDGERAFNLAWHDWLNLRSLIEVSEAIASAALHRENSRGAHLRQAFPA